VKIDTIQPYIGSDVTEEDFDRWLDDVRERLSVEFWREIGTTGNPVFKNSWANEGGLMAPASFYKDPFNTARLQGVIDTGLSGTIAFTLPEDYRPKYEVGFVVYNSNGGPGPGAAAVNVVIKPNGDVIPTFGAGTNVYLNDISFRV